MYAIRLGKRLRGCPSGLQYRHHVRQYVGHSLPEKNGGGGGGGEGVPKEISLTAINANWPSKDPWHWYPNIPLGNWTCYRQIIWAAEIRFWNQNCDCISRSPIVECRGVLHTHQQLSFGPSRNGYRCNRLRCPLARISSLQCFNMGHNGHGINMYGVSMTPMGN